MADAFDAVVVGSGAGGGAAAWALCRAGARVLVLDRGRQACSYCGFCGSYGCEVGAKSSSMETFLAFARKTGRLTLRAGCRAMRVAPGEVVYRDASGAEQRARGRAVVVACSAIETAR